jgi:hypothetical protein
VAHRNATRNLCMCGHMRTSHGLRRADGLCTACGFEHCVRYRPLWSRKPEMQVVGLAASLYGIPTAGVAVAFWLCLLNLWPGSLVVIAACFLPITGWRQELAAATYRLSEYQRRRRIDIRSREIYALAEAVRERGVPNIDEHPPHCGCPPCREVRAQMACIEIKLADLLGRGGQQA